MKRYLPLTIVAVAGLLTAAIGTMLYRAKRSPVLAITQNSTAQEKGIAGSMHVRGEADAPVTLEEFGDFQCPPCGKLASASRQIEKDYGAKLRFIFRQFPLPAKVHAHAQEAALASEAAGRQDRFWEMHDLLYREQDTWSKSTDVRALFNGYAGMLGLNLDRFKTDLDSPEIKERVASDQARGVALGVRSTPTIFVNDRQVPPPVESDTLRAAIDAALKAKATP